MRRLDRSRRRRLDRWCRAGVIVACAPALLALLAEPARGFPAPSGDATPRASTAPGTAYLTFRAPILVHVEIARPFQAPLTAYGPGHRGVDLVLAQNARVVAAGEGVVAFAGAVAGRSLVVIAHPDGLTTEYEPVMPAVRTGQRLARGAVIGTLHGSHGDAGSCLHWGARRGGQYFDPMALLAPLGPVRLIA